MLRLPIVPPERPEDTVIGSSLCVACSYSAAGCCAAPPRMDWSDVARVVRHGGRDWLLEQIATGTLRPFDHGLSLRRDAGRVENAPGAPRIKKCVFHHGRGCTIPETHRPATCNYYVCKDALDDGDRTDAGSGARALVLHDELVERFTSWDAEIHARIQARWPDGVVWDASFLDALEEEFARIAFVAAGS